MDRHIGDVQRESALQKTLKMERSVSLLRGIVISVNVFAWFVFLGPTSPRAPAALAVICIAVPYAIWSLLGRPFERYPLLRFGAFTLAMDAALITVWTYATGGTTSEFWVIYFISVVSVAMRYDLLQTLGAASAEAGMLLGLYLLDGGAAGISVLIRPAYVVIAGLAAGMLARQERISREERIVFERLAGEHAELLAREKHTVERLRELDRLKTEFIAHAAHELRTPLTTLSGFASMLGTRSDEMTPEQIAVALEAMRRQGERTRLLVQNLLDLTQFESGEAQLALQPVSVASALREAVAAAPPPEGHEVELEITDDGPVTADRQRLSQVVISLLSNAYAYGGPHVRCRSTGRNGSVLLSISDDGPGVPLELAPSLFQPFRRGANAGNSLGTGLGLAICRRMVEAFGGDLSYEPTDPDGPTFTITLPRVA